MIPQLRLLSPTPGIIALANAIPDMRAILSMNLLKNGIGVEQARALVIILKEHPTLKSLCGNRGDETMLDMRGKMNGADDAIMLAAEIVDNGAMSTVVVNNGANGAMFPLPIQDIKSKAELDFSGKKLKVWRRSIGMPKRNVCASKLNLKNNWK